MSGALFLLPFLLGGLFLTGAAMAGAPPARPEIDPDHKAALRQIVSRIGGTDRDPYNGAQERQMFPAHYPRIANIHRRLVAGVTVESVAWGALNAEMVKTAIAEFPPQDFWMNGGAVAKGRHRLAGHQERVHLAPTEIRVTQTMVGGEPLPRYLGWDGHVVWDPVKGSSEADANDAELERKVEMLRAWFIRIEGSEQAMVYRDALRNVATLRAELAEVLEPIQHHEPIWWSRKCRICRPRKWSRR